MAIATLGNRFYIFSSKMQAQKTVVSWRWSEVRNNPSNRPLTFLRCFFGRLLLLRRFRFLVRLRRDSCLWRIFVYPFTICDLCFRNQSLNCLAGSEVVSDVFYSAALFIQR